MVDNRHEWTLMVTDEEEQALEQFLAKLRAVKRDEEAQSRKNKHFLKSAEQEKNYRKHVLAYYQRYLCYGEVSHKQQMLHWAAIYHVIAERTGSLFDKNDKRKLVFHGPEFDRFVKEYCGIPYNESNNAKGRYRQVGDVFRKFAGIAEFGAPSLTAHDRKLHSLYLTYISNFKDECGAVSSKVSYRAGVVPSGWNNL